MYCESLLSLTPLDVSEFSESCMMPGTCGQNERSSSHGKGHSSPAQHGCVLVEGTRSPALPPTGALLRQSPELAVVWGLPGDTWKSHSIDALLRQSLSSPHMPSQTENPLTGGRDGSGTFISELSRSRFLPLRLWGLITSAGRGRWPGCSIDPAPAALTL